MARDPGQGMMSSPRNSPGLAGRNRSRSSLVEGQSRFPQLRDCAHFHYDFVELGHIQLTLEDVLDGNTMSSPHRVLSGTRVTAEASRVGATSSGPTHPGLSESLSAGSDSSAGASTGPVWALQTDKNTSSRPFAHGPVDSVPHKDVQDGDPVKVEYFAVRVTSRDRAWFVRHDYAGFCALDIQLHRCIYDRRYSLLPELSSLNLSSTTARKKKKVPTATLR